jgi:hypothetical protein
VIAEDVRGVVVAVCATDIRLMDMDNEKAIHLAYSLPKP